MSVIRTVSEILESNNGMTLTLSYGSFKIIEDEDSIIRKDNYEYTLQKLYCTVVHKNATFFLFTIHSNYGLILYHFRDKILYTNL